MAHHSDAEWFAVIGAIIVHWGSIEKLVSSSIHNIETEVAIARGDKPVHTDLSALRDFKERKGCLRKLFEQHALPDELAKLDAFYQRLVEPGRIRHSLAHDVVVLQPMTGELGIIRHGNPARGKPSETQWKTFEEIAGALREISGIPSALGHLTLDVSLRIVNASQNAP